MQGISKKRRINIAILKSLMLVATITVLALVVFLIVYVFVKGFPNISWELLSTKPSYTNGTIGILPDILNTLYIVFATLIIVLPLGVGAAIYLSEYAKKREL
jgi:phosphate transport system permease protein